MSTREKIVEDSSLSVRPKVRTKKATDAETMVGDPIDKKSIKVLDKDGNQTNISALNYKFAEALVYVKYTRPPITVEDISMEHQKNKELFEWMETITTFEYNIKILLRLPMHRFWSTVMHEKGFHVMLESYLRNAPRFFDRHYLTLITDQMKETIKRIHNLVFRLFLRMTCLKESKKDHISPEVHGQIIYEHYAFDIPKLFDLCTLYGNINPHVTSQLKRIINNVFQANNSYYDDLQQSVRTLISCCERMQAELHLNEDAVDSQRASSMSLRPQSLTWSDMQDLLYFITDFSVSISSFAAVFAPAANVYQKCKLQNVIVNIYENVFPVLKKEVQSRFSDTKIVMEDMRQMFCIAQNYLLNAFREIVVNCCLNPLLDESLDLNCKSVIIDLYLDLVGLATSEHNFCNDYFVKYSFEEDLSTLIENSEVTGFHSVDQTRIDYFLNVLSSGNKKPVPVFPMSQKNSLPVDEKPMLSTMDNAPVNNYDEGNAVDKVTLESYITSITDILPDLGPGFIEQCLEYYNYDVEKVVDALLSADLPDCLQKLDRKMERPK